jgi:hypothetical protein
LLKNIHPPGAERGKRAKKTYPASPSTKTFANKYDLHKGYQYE